MAHLHFNTPSRLERVNFKLLNRQHIALFIKRDDLIHPEVSGNKWRKLKLNIAQARYKKHDTILTFGGAHSNHIAATAAVAARFGMKSIGIIRGEDANPENATLKAALENGMELKRVSRSDFKTLQNRDSADRLREIFGRFYGIPQGGANFYGVQGCQAIITELDFVPDRIFVACGTATTLSGMAIANAAKSNIYGISVLKGGAFLANTLDENLREIYRDAETEHYIRQKVHLLQGYHFGGYAKTTPGLIDFMRQFTSETGIKLDPVYTAKAAFGMADFARKLIGSKPEKWVFIHTGGLQGIPAMEAKLGFSIYDDC